MDPAVPPGLIANPRLSQWLSFARPGIVELRSGKVEIGQGVATALVQIAADELCIPLSAIELVAGDTRDTPDEGWTSASISIEQGGSAVRHVCADVRRAFVAAAAAALDVAAEDVVLVDGVFSAAGRNTAVSYWALADAVDLNRDYCPGAPLVPPAMYRHVGQTVPRIDLPAKLAGGGFIHDERVAGMAHGRVLRPPRAGCHLQKIDVDAIGALPGVEGVHVDGDFIGLTGAREELLIAAAAAATDHIVWSDGPPLPSMHAVQAELRSARAERRVVVPAEVLAPAGARRHQASYSRPYLAHASIGLVCAIAEWSDDGVNVWSQTQGVYPLQRSLALALDVPVEAVRVIHRHGAGCYGHNGADDVALDAALLARMAGQPVRVVWTRAEELGWAPFGPTMAVDLAASLAEDGTVIDWRHEIWSTSHLSRPGWGDGVNLLAAGMLANPKAPSPTADPLQLPFGGGGDRNAIPLYAFPQQEVVYNFVLDPPLRTSALRSLGAFANVFAIESFMDELAAQAGCDPVAFRLRHLDDPRARAVIEAAATAAGWQAGAEGAGDRGRGIGFARYKNKAAWCAVVVDVELTDKVRVARVWAAVDAGLVINPDGLRNQIEGGIVQAISWTLVERVRWDAGGITSLDWDSYPILSFDDVPEIEVVILDRVDEPSRGVGECAAGPVAAAIGNAVCHAIGVRVRDLPIDAAALITAIEAA